MLTIHTLASLFCLKVGKEMKKVRGCMQKVMCVEYNLTFASFYFSFLLANNWHDKGHMYAASIYIRA